MRSYRRVVQRRIAVLLEYVCEHAVSMRAGWSAVPRPQLVLCWRLQRNDMRIVVRKGRRPMRRGNRLLRGRLHRERLYDPQSLQSRPLHAGRATHARVLDLRRDDMRL